MRYIKMELNLKKLIQFDLIEDIESSTSKDENRMNQFFNFLDTYQQIQSVDQFIRDCPSYPGSTKAIIKNELVSAVGATLAIEGTILDDDEIKESFRKASLQEELERKEQEAENARKAYEHIKDLVENHKGEFVYKEGHIKKIHKLITQKIDYFANVPGEYRDLKASFGDPRRYSLCEDKASINMAMTRLIKWLNTPSSGILSSNIIVKAFMAHYYLAEIHPFGDGNGRTARGLEALILYVNKINSYCFKSMTKFWNINRTKYITHLGNIRLSCDPLDFLIWGANGFLSEIQKVKEAVLRKLKQLMLMDYLRWLLATKKYQKSERKINHRIYGNMSLLTASGKISFNKFMSSPEVKSLYSGVSVDTKNRDLRKMKSLGLIQTFKENDEMFIEANYEILEKIEYMV